jgi:tetratricopeptide (TPR) repeat protein/tRNA A-37 threonylcarbamoyl transferase component Bud32
MPDYDVDRSLYFGILALQMDLITRDDLMTAMAAWAEAKRRPIGEILVEAGTLALADRADLERMMERRIAQEGGDPARSLAALSSVGSVVDELRRSIADADILDSIAAVATTRGEDPYATRAPDPFATRAEGSDISQTHDPYATLAEVSPEQPTSGSTPDRTSGSRFRKVREHAAGNLGVVYVARDEELNRDVALKEIKDRNADHPYSQAKFLLEAEVTGGLEHPGIVPVYGLGHHDDGRPFYAMRFIRGKSLLDAIKKFHADDSLKFDPGRRTLALQKLLRRFTDVCNAVAYAHSRGVLHRDLKPDNVMVGKYGETLVVDWGLAKALGRIDETGAVTDPDDHLPEGTLQPSTSGDVEATYRGAVVGTPAYMSPEQAAGRHDLLGPASDIYSLGATLYHLLVGRPSIGASTLQELLEKIKAGEITRPRSLAPWIDPALEAICLKAMALEPSDRYTTPRAFAEDLDGWIAGEPVTAYREPFHRRAGRWARRHRTALAIGATAATVSVLLLGGIGWVQFAKRQQTDAAARSTMGKAEGLATEAQVSGDVHLWEKAIEEALLARERLESGGGSPALLLQADARLEAFQAALAAEKKDRKVVVALEEARLERSKVKGNELDVQSRLDAYGQAFHDYGIDLTTLSTENAAECVRSSKVAEDLVAAVDDWIFYEKRKDLVDRLEAIARAADPDPLRTSIRDAITKRDTTSLRRLCESEDNRRKLGLRFRNVFNSLLYLDPERSFPLLETILRENPSDFWLNYDVGTAYQDVKPPRLAEARHYLSVAVALRPDSPAVRLNLGAVLAGQGKHDLAIAEYRDAIRIKPDHASAYNNLGNSLRAQGKLDQAVATFRDAIRIKPDLAEAHVNLGNALADQGKPDLAIEAYRKAIGLKPGNAVAHYCLGCVLATQGKLDDATASFRDAIRINPDYADAQFNLGGVLFSQGKFDLAVAAYREALRIKPDFAEALCNLGLLLSRQGKFREALEATERGHELGSRRPDWSIASEPMVREARRLVDLEAKITAVLHGQAKPTDNAERLTLARVCYTKGLHAASTRFYEEAFAEQPALAGDLSQGHRYKAACGASLAGTRSGKDDPPPDSAARVKLREKALGWLRADVAAWSKVLDGNEPARKRHAAGILALWQKDSDLACIRDEAALAKFSEAERKAFRVLWADVESLRKRAEDGGRSKDLHADRRPSGP